MAGAAAAATTGRRMVSLVRGYWPACPVPEEIPASWYKFEIIQHTAGGSGFDVEMSLDVILGLTAFFAPCSWEAEMESGLCCRTADEFRQAMFRQKKLAEELGDEFESDWIREMRIWDSNRRLLMHLKLRNWNLWGGPYPYCDSYAYECYLCEDCVAALQNRFLGIFSEKQIFVYEILCGGERRPAGKWSGFFFRLLKRRCHGTE